MEQAPRNAEAWREALDDVETKAERPDRSDNPELSRLLGHESLELESRFERDPLEKNEPIEAPSGAELARRVSQRAERGGHTVGADGMTDEERARANYEQREAAHQAHTRQTTSWLLSGAVALIFLLAILLATAQ